MSNGPASRHSTFNVQHSPFPPRNHQLLQSLPILLRGEPYGRAGGTTPHAGGAAADLAAEVALHGHGLLDFFLRLGEQGGHPREETSLRFLVNHEDVVVGAV